MPIIYNEGKDRIIFASEEEHAAPSKIDLPDPEPSPGLILSNGEINWNCPCLGGMATGPCGVEFREAFSCFHYSTSEPKGSDCYETFKLMQTCMSDYPALYGNKESSANAIGDETSEIVKENKASLNGNNLTSLHSSEEVPHLQKDIRSEIVRKN